MALTSAEKKKKQEELNRQGKLYLQAKAKGDKRAMAAARATADKIRKEAGWSYDAKTGTTYEKVSPIQKKGTVVNSKENLAMAKAGANPVKAVQQAAKKSSILTNSPASKSSVQQAKKAADTAAKKKADVQKQAEKSLPALGGLMDKSTQTAVNNLTAGSKKNVSGTLALGNGPVKNALPVAQSAQKSSGSKWTADNIAKGFGYGAERTLSGAVGAVEDTLRFVSGYGNKLLSGITSLGGLADNPVSDFLAKTAEDTLANSLTDQWKQDIQDRYQPDKTAQFIGSLGEAAGAMLPTIAAGLATGGMSAGTAIGKGAAMTAQAAQAAERTANGIALASMLPSVMESSTRRAMQEGADINEALIYGALSGALETGTESLFAGLPGMKRGTVSDIIKRITQNPVAERALDIAGEGAEEVISGAADPYLQRMTYNENAKNASAGELAGQFATGALLSGVMQGASGVAARVADAGLAQRGQKNSVPEGTPFAVSDVLNRLRGQKEKTPYMRPDAGLQLPSTVADGVFLDSNITQDHAPVKAKNDKSTDPLLLNRLQLPDSMADDAFVDSSITQGEAESKPVSEALLWAMGKTLPNPVVQRNAYRAQIDAVFSGNMPTSKKIFLGDTPDVVAKYGMQAPLTMTQTTARKIAYPPGYLGGKHNLGIPALKHLPEQLADPIAILKSKTEGDSVVVLTAWNDTQGNPVIIPVHFGKDGTLTVENAIPSAYGKRNLEALFGENGENILYTKNNKSIDQLLSSRLQLPNAMADDTLVAYSIAQESAENNQTGDILRRVTGQAKQDVPVKTGQATVIYHPYDGKVPQNRANTPREQPMEISQDAVDKAKQAKAQTSAVEKGKSKLKNMMLSVFRSMGGQRKVTMDSVIFEGEPYTVDLNTRLVSKVVSGQDTSPERLAVMYVLDDAVKSAQYVGSGRYGKDKAKAGSVIRYDYFENDLIIDGNPYIMTFDVEVQKGQNNFRTYRVINEINLTPTAAYVGPLPTASHVRKSGLSRENSIAQNGTADNPIPDVLRRVTGIENPPETAAEIRAAEQSAQAGMQQSMEYMDAWNAEADRNTAQSTIPQAEMQADTQDTTGQETPGRVKAAAKDLYRNFISGQAELEAVAKAQKKIDSNRANAEDLVQMSRTADATVDMIAAGHMVDRAGSRMGDSWNDLVGALTSEQSRLLNLYRQHKHNINRMSLKEKAAPALQSVRDELAALRAQYPGMAAMTESQLQETVHTERGHLQATAREFLDAMEREKQLAAITDKPVLGKREEGKSQTIPYTAEESRKIVQELEQAHPELKKQAEAIQRFHDDFMREWAVGSGLMSEAQWQALKDKYPDYVQTFRARDPWGNADTVRHGRVDSMSPIRQAVGDVSEIVPFEDAEMTQVNSIVKAARRNELFSNLYEFAKTHPKQAAPFIRVRSQDDGGIETGDYDSAIEQITQEGMRQENGSYLITAMIDGKPVQMEVNAEIYAGLQNLFGQDKGASDAFGAKVSKWVTNPFKQLTTGRNPLFFLSNFPKDFQTAYINTTSGRKTMAGYLVDVTGTIRSMAQNSAEWQTFQALGGKNSGFYHNEKGFRESAKTAEHRGVRRALDVAGTPFEMVSENTEALWRFHEYRTAVRKYGDTPEGRAKAMQAAADVTTNFSRSAPMAKAAENYCAYLNASLQGLDKMARQIKGHPFLTTRRAAEIIALPTILLYMLNKDDEDYQHLNDRTKDNYYCIPTGKGTFIKIPKSREYGVAMGALLERFMRLRDGEDPETALDGIGGQFLTNIAPSNPFTDNIAKTIFIDLPTNRDFAGRSIVPERLKDLSPENQYDYTTSKAGMGISKAWNATLGRILPELSPIQADYLIDSNLGFVGDIILGSTQQENKSVKDVLRAVIAEPVQRKLIADPLYQNGVTDAFYKELSKAETAAGDRNITEDLEERVITPEEKYLSALKKSNSEISELRGQERQILSDRSISKEEQEEQVREIRREINRIALAAKGKAEQERDAWAKTYIPEISHMTDEKQAQARAAYEQNGTPYTDFVRYDDRYRLLQKDKETSSATDRAKLAGYLEGDDTLTDEQKEGLYEHLLIPYLSDGRKEDWDNTYKSKVAPSLFFEIANEYSQIGDELDDLEKGKAQAKATAFSMYLDGMGLSDDVRGQVENDFKYFNMNPAKSENYTFEMMRKNGGKNEQAYADALKQSGLSIETYYEIKDMKNAKDTDGSYTYKKDDIVKEMRDKGFTTAQIGAVCGAFGWKAPSSGSGKSSSSKSKSSSSSSTENTLRRLTGLPKLPKLGK